MIATTIEQAKRLIAAGIDTDTADLCYTLTGFNYDYSSKTPAWSMSQLWDILNKAGIHYYEYQTGNPIEEVMESLVAAVERLYKSGGMKNE